MALSLALNGALENLSMLAGSPFAVQMPGGIRHAMGTGDPAFTLTFHTRAALAATALRGHMGLLEAYFDQQVDVDNLDAALAAAMSGGFDTRPRLLNLAENRLHELRYANSDVGRAKANARFHYGLGTPFYKSWLDDALMMYTCGYWDEHTRTLEQAQRNKVEHVCRKIRLSPGDRFIDIGCGFGGFMFHAAEHHQASGVGLNTTTEQVDWLREEIGRRQLGGQLAVREADFREVDGQYDKVVSIGVLEHAGRDQLREVVRAHADFLKPGGLGMLHFIGHVGRFETELFIRKHVFPGGWIPSLADVIVEMERAGLEVVDIENLRRHYAPTLDAWASRFESNWETIRATDTRRFDERFRRIWMTYLVGCAEMFRLPNGYTHLFQIVFSKGNITRANYPMSRAHLYDR
ncbi:SAM-dependent methyltransferase [Bordetella genomosp. 11]|uniref:Cyclopropane-fatty-acyl-phospholipid synthase n=1 Tax=Bordetella genomosp. 11 TaxID=1416808 RepID=A0A261UWW8_9BORD|nr:cyclopropane-fatty-acyl-phospholipid synthase family protein [Bordetella genomosp. 11]OZI66396.1 cyclopropane-fatty-acyl-phospholipid synthase [Bordetella genomosp. 11]